MTIKEFAAAALEQVKANPKLAGVSVIVGAVVDRLVMFFFKV